MNALSSALQQWLPNASATNTGADMPLLLERLFGAARPAASPLGADAESISVRNRTHHSVHRARCTLGG